LQQVTSISQAISACEARVAQTQSLSCSGKATTAKGKITNVLVYQEEKLSVFFLTREHSA
jgi:hypothetical protein